MFSCCGCPISIGAAMVAEGCVCRGGGNSGAAVEQRNGGRQRGGEVVAAESGVGVEGEAKETRETKCQHRRSRAQVHEQSSAPADRGAAAAQTTRNELPQTAADARSAARHEHRRTGV
jgi:hypothetical protein